MSKLGPIRRRTRMTLVLPALVTILTAALAGVAGDTRADGPLIHADEWARFTARFVLSDGRVVDRENGGVAHSESQGYGMILAAYAQDRRTFDRIWSFTRRELQVRESDNLLAWKWDPKSLPRVADQNNATDGDILVAYALLRAAALWSDVVYAREADAIIDDIGRKLIDRVDGRTVLRAADYGFDSIPGNRGPVVNPSYYVFAAFPLFEVMRPEYPWRELAEDGLELLLHARTGRTGLVPDWIALAGGTVRVAEGFRPRSSYDAVRVPLYLVHGRLDPEIAATFDEVWNLDGPGRPVDYHLALEKTLNPMGDPGYRAIAALLACARRGAPFPTDLARFSPTTYFASSLHLFALAVARQDYPGCLPGGEPASPIYLASQTSPAYTPQAGRAPTIIAGRAVPLDRPQAVRAASLPGYSTARPLSEAEEGMSFSDRIMRKRWLPRR